MTFTKWQQRTLAVMLCIGVCVWVCACEWLRVLWELLKCCSWKVQNSRANKLWSQTHTYQCICICVSAAVCVCCCCDCLLWWARPAEIKHGAYFFAFVNENKLWCTKITYTNIRTYMHTYTHVFVGMCAKGIVYKNRFSFVAKVVQL